MAIQPTVSDARAQPRIRVHATAEIGQLATVGNGTQIWNQVQIRDGAEVGEDCVLGKGVYIDTDVVVGNQVKLENRVSLFRGDRLADGVFVGPHSCLLNDKRPRAITPEGRLKTEEDWQVSPVTVGQGASIGGGCTVLPGVRIGQYAMVGAGSVVTRDVPDYALVFGNPARLAGYVCECGTRIDEDGCCHICGRTHDFRSSDQ